MTISWNEQAELPTPPYGVSAVGLEPVQQLALFSETTSYTYPPGSVYRISPTAFALVLESNDGGVLYSIIHTADTDYVDYAEFDQMIHSEATT